MSSQVYPDLPGLAFDVHRAPSWRTDIRTTPSRREYRSTDQVYPMRRRVLVYEFLRTYASLAELQTLEGFFNLHKGALDSFLFNDPDDNTVTTAQVIGTGDASNKDFQLARAWGGVVEPIASRRSTQQVYKDGVLQTAGTDYTFVSGGLVYPLNSCVCRFTTAPGVGAVISWTGGYYWRCRFNKDELDFVKFLNQIWKTGSVELFDSRT